MSGCSRQVIDEVEDLFGVGAVKDVANVEDGGQVEERGGFDRLHPERTQGDPEWASQGDRKTSTKMLRSGFCRCCC
jgi:hypothetical protein